MIERDKIERLRLELESLGVLRSKIEFMFDECDSILKERVIERVYINPYNLSEV